MYDEICDSLDGGEAQVEIERLGGVDYIVLTVLDQHGPAASISFDSETARTLAQVLNRLSANIA